MAKLTRERIEYLLMGARQEMCHGGYLPNIPEREELCRLALKGLKAEKLRGSLKIIHCGCTFDDLAEFDREEVGSDGL